MRHSPSGRACAKSLPTHAEFVAEMARQVVFDAYGDEAYTKGLTVWTTIRKADQEAAYAAVRRGVIDYDRRHGYRGPEAYVKPARATRPSAERCSSGCSGNAPTATTWSPPSCSRPRRPRSRPCSPTATRSDHRRRAQVRRPRAGRQGAAEPAHPPRRGDPARAGRQGPWAIAQLPQAESAFVALRPHDGAILALIGGFDFERNKFNHVTQAQRQPGSAFKPFIYSAALEKGFTPATIVNDAPFFVPADKAGGEDWEPKNYDGKFDGPMRIRTALAKSKNLVTVRVLQAIGPQYAQDYITRFGFDPKLHPAYLTMGLGAGVGDAAADGERLRGLRQRRLSGRAVPDRQDHRRQGQRAVRGQAGDRGRRAPSARSIRATRSS